MPTKRFIPFVFPHASAVRVAVVFAACVAAYAADASAQSLGDVLRNSLPTHPRVIEAIDAAAAAGAEIQLAETARNIRITGEGGVGKQKLVRSFADSTVWSPAVRARKLLFDGGRVDHDVQLREARTTYARLSVRALEEDVGMQLVQAYIQVARAKDALRISQAWVDGLRALETMTMDISRIDRGRQVDYAHATSRVTQANAQMIARKAAVAEAERQLNELVQGQVRIETPLAIDLDRIAAVDERPLDVEAHPKVMVALASARVAERQMALDALYDKPQLNLEVFASSGQDPYGKNHFLNAVGVQLVSGINIMDGGTGKATVNVDAKRLQQANATVDTERLDARVNLARDRGAEEGRRERLVQFQSAARMSRQLRGLMTEQFKAGRRPLLDLISQESDIYQAELGLSQEIYDGIFNRIRIAYDHGELLNVFNIPSSVAVNR